MKPLLVFHQRLQASNQLIEGRLLLIDVETCVLQNTYIATSGLPNYQSSRALSTKGRGPIPSNIDIADRSYSVVTSPLFMPNVKGVEGNFYKINPHLVVIDGVQRGDFGVHFDANFPGSSGCVVIRTPNGWEAFEKDMKVLVDAGVKQVPLLVSYSR